MSGVKVPKCIDVSKLKLPDGHETLIEKLDRLVFDGTWENFKDQVYSVGAKVLGFRVKNHKVWFDENLLFMRNT